MNFCPSQLQVGLQKYNCTPKFFMTFFSHSLQTFLFSPPFSTLSNLQVTTTYFTLYNCKLHFTTAEIVISYTLKYALFTLSINMDKINFLEGCRYNTSTFHFFLCFGTPTSVAPT